MEECFSEDIRSEITQKQIDNKEGITSVEHIELKAAKEMTADDWKYVTGSQYILDLRNENDSLDEIERWLGVR